MVLRLLLACLWILIGPTAFGQATRDATPSSPLPDPAPFRTEPSEPSGSHEQSSKERRLNELEAMNRRLLEQVESLSKQVAQLSRRLDERDAEDGEGNAREGNDESGDSPESSDRDQRSSMMPDLPSDRGDVPLPTEQSTGVLGIDGWSTDLTGGSAEVGDPKSDDESSFEVGYDEGFFLRGEASGVPYGLRVRGRIQFRNTNFVRSARLFFNAAGLPGLIEDRDDFDIERARLILRGYFFDQDLTYFFNIDGDTDGRSQLDLLDFHFGYRFGNALAIRLGKRRVPISRAWINSTRYQQLADRSLATSFFRPDRSQGIWIEGEPSSRLHYLAMISNGFTTNGLRFDDLDENYAFTGSVYQDLGSEYGRGYSDLSYHEAPAFRFGTTSGFERASPPTNPFLMNLSPEFDFIRLSDGTPIGLLGALAPDVTVLAFDQYQLTVDAGWKYRGLSLSGEYYFRWLQAIRGTGPLPTTTLFDHGFYAQAGYFLIPERLEVLARTSQIWGEFGTASEYAGGFNWFIRGSHDLKFSFDAARVIGAPTSSTGPDYQAGQTGTLIRTQFQAAF